MGVNPNVSSFQFIFKLQGRWLVFKTGNEARQIPVNDTLEILFKEIRKKNGFKSKNIFLYDGQVIETKTGRLRKPKKKTEARPVLEVKNSFGSVIKRAGIVDFRFHDLRHTFASQVLLRGGDLKDIQELLGHKTMTMTLRYAHLTQEHKRKAVNLLNGLTGNCVTKLSQKRILAK